MYHEIGQDTECDKDIKKCRRYDPEIAKVKFEVVTNHTQISINTCVYLPKQMDVHTLIHTHVDKYSHSFINANSHTYKHS